MLTQTELWLFALIFRIMTDKKIKFENGKNYQLVFVRSTNKNGKVVYPKKAKAMCFWSPVD